MTHARTFTPGDLIETERDAEALPPGTLVADRDGDPALRLARGGWHRLAPSQGGRRWSRWMQTPAYRPWRVLALGCSDDMPAEVAIRAALAEPHVEIRNLGPFGRALGCIRLPGEGDAQYRARLAAPPSAAEPVLARTRTAALAALREVDPDAALADGPGWARATVSPACDLKAVARALHDSLAAGVEARGEWTEHVVDASGGLREVRLSLRPVRVGDVVPGALVPDRAIAQVVRDRSHCVRWGERGTYIESPTSSPRHPQRWGQAVSRVWEDPSRGWPWSNLLGDRLTVLALDQPVTALRDPAEVCRVAGWEAAGYQVEGNAVRAPEEAAPPAAPAVGDEVSLERLPVGAVAGRAGDLGELVIKRRAPGPSDLGAQFVTSARHSRDGHHLIWGARGAAWPMHQAAWRILALDVSPEATAEEAVAAAMPALEAHGYERRGDRIWRRAVAPAPIVAVVVGDEVDAADLPPGGVGRRGDDRGTDFSGRFLARRADGQGWWFGPAGCDPGDVDGRDLIAGRARWGTRGADRGVDRVRVVALGATDEELRDPAWLRRALGDVPGSAWATPRVEVAAPALASGMQVALHEAPVGWLVAEVGGEGRVWLRREGGGGRRVLTAHGWLSASTGTWQWPVAGDGACSVHAAGSAPVRLVAPLPDAPRGDYDRAARAAVWRASEAGLCQVTPALLPDLAFGLAAGALGPKMRDRVACADSSEAVARALPHAREGGALVVWALGTVALLGDAWGHAAVIAAETLALVAEGDPSLTTIALRGLAGARRADVRAWLSDGAVSVGWRSGGLSCALWADAGGYAWSTQDASGPAETRAACAAALVDHLLHVAQRAPLLDLGARRTVDSCHVWTASAAQADGPRSLGPLVVAPGSAAGLVLGTSSRAVAVAAADVARLARSGKAASQRAFAIAPCAPAGGDVEAARAVLRRLDAAGLLP